MKSICFFKLNCSRMNMSCWQSGQFATPGTHWHTCLQSVMHTWWQGDLTVNVVLIPRLDCLCFMPDSQAYVTWTDFLVLILLNSTCSVRLCSYSLPRSWTVPLHPVSDRDLGCEQCCCVCTRVVDFINLWTLPLPVVCSRCKSLQVFVWWIIALVYLPGKSL